MTVANSASGANRSILLPLGVILSLTSGCSEDGPFLRLDAFSFDDASPAEVDGTFIGPDGGTVPCAPIQGSLPAPAYDVQLPTGWKAEHLAFALGSSDKPTGGPARWAVGGPLPKIAIPAEQYQCPYAEQPGAYMFITDQRRKVWLLENGEVWPVAGTDDLGEVDGPGPYARFVYSGGYGGSHWGTAAANYTLYMVDNGWLRQLARQEDGTWEVTTLAGQGEVRVRDPGPAGPMSDLLRLGKGIAVNPEGTVYFSQYGGLLRGKPGGEVEALVTIEQARAEMTRIYAERWPQVEPQKMAIGNGETVDFLFHPNGALYGTGRTFPAAWRVTEDLAGEQAVAAANPGTWWSEPPGSLLPPAPISFRPSAAGRWRDSC